MRHLLIALGFLTKIPVPKDLIRDKRDLPRSMAYFPLAGLVIGLILVCVNTLLSRFLPDQIVNAFLVLFLIMLTGGIHLDGLADTVDGFCSKARSKEETLRIMRDPRIGTMGVIGLVMMLLFKYELLCAIPAMTKDIALILMCSISRWDQVFTAHFSVYAREGEGTGRDFIGTTTRFQFLTAAVFTLFLCLTAWLLKGLIVLVLACAGTWLMMKYAQKKIGGATGDTIGAASEISEVLVLLMILILGGLS